MRISAVGLTTAATFDTGAKRSSIMTVREWLSASLLATEDVLRDLALGAQDLRQRCSHTSGNILQQSHGKTEVQESLRHFLCSLKVVSARYALMIELLDEPLGPLA